MRATATCRAKKTLAGPATEAEPDAAIPRKSSLTLPNPDVAAREAGRASRCFHCGERNPAGSRWRAKIEGLDACFCCAGCLAVAQTIRAAGLSAFYLHRDGPSPNLPGDDDDADRAAQAAAAMGVVTPIADSLCEAALLMEGLRCGACVWLLETRLAQQPGVRHASVNFATRRARVRFAPDETDLATILRVIASIGYRAHAYDPRRREAIVRGESRALLRRMALALLGMMQVMMFAAPAYVSAEGIDADHRALLNWASFVITLPVVVYSAAPFLQGAWRDLRRLRRPGMDVPIALGIVAAFGASTWSTVVGAGDVYFDSITMFVALVLVARWLELRVREKAGDVLEATARDVPLGAERLVGYPDAPVAHWCAARTLVPGDIVRVPAGASIPADGEVVDGRSSVEEAVLTGESRPRAKLRGDRVLAGSVNCESPLVMRVSAAGEATALRALTRLVERAAGERPRIARLADRCASLFVAVLLVIAAIAALAWWRIDAERMLPVAIAVLAVSCPCALSLATPAALTSAAGALARRGILVVRADALEALSRVTHVVLDKTGTLTTGHLRLLGIEPAAGVAAERCLAVATALEQGCSHPIAHALATRGAHALHAQDIVSIPGCGVEGSIDGERYRLGRAEWVAEFCRDAVQQSGCPVRSNADAQADADAIVVTLAAATRMLGNLRFGDSRRDGAPELVASLQSAGLRVSILSGDRAANVARVARDVGVADWHAGATPDDKRAFIAALQARGAVVAMVGDGINDAPSLARADVSIAQGDASALTQWTADVVVTGTDLEGVAFALAAAHRTFRVIRQNLGWALAYNALAVPLAATGHLSPLVAAAGMSASSLAVVGNAWRLSRPARTGATRVTGRGVAARAVPLELRA